MCGVEGVGAEDMATEEGAEESDEEVDAADEDAALALDLEQVVGAEGVVGLVGAGPITCCSKRGERVRSRCESE